MPLYLVLSVIFSVAVWSLWLPKWLGNVNNVDAAPITNFSTAINAVSSLPSGAQIRLAYNNGTYAMVFASTSIASAFPTSTCAIPVAALGGQGCKLFFTSSVDGGTTWGTPVLISSTLFFSSPREAISDFSYDSRRSVWVVTYKESAGGTIVQSYSTSGASWTTATVLNNPGSGTHYIGRNVAMAFATSSDLRAVFAQRGDFLVVGTTSNSGLTTTWPTSSIRDISGYKNNNSGDWEMARPLGISIDSSNNIHAVYALATTTAAGGYEIVYASSTDLGVTWTTSSISGRMSILSAGFEGFEIGAASTAIDPYTGRLSVTYMQTTAVGPNVMTNYIMVATSSLKYGQLGANGVWATSTISSGVISNYFFGSSFTFVGLNSNVGMTVPYTGMYTAAFFSTNTNSYLAVNTSTTVIENINNVALNHMSRLASVYNPTMKELGVAYVNSSTAKIGFTTTSMRLAAVNDFATTTVINPSFASDASGLVTVTTTVTDVNHETVTLYVDYSVDGGVTWSSSTLRTATGEGGSLTTSTGKITGIATSNNTQAVTFTWDSLANLPATSTANVKLRVLADDGVSAAGYGYSALFTVDNLAPGIPEVLTLTPSTSTIGFNWSASTGTASMYLVSSTAMSVSTTVALGVTSTDLAPNTIYYFQVQAQDSYSNTSSLSSVTSTYTDPVVPTSTVAVSAGSTSMTVTWESYNGTGTVYEVYNVTTGALAATTTNKTYTVTGLTAATSYQFKVRAIYLSNSAAYSEYSTDSTAVATDAAASSGSSGSSGGGGAATPAAPPAVPVTQPVAPATSVSLNLSLNNPVVEKVGAATHTFTLLAASAQTISVKIQSEPITVSLNTSIPKDVDTNNDGIVDLRVTYGGIVQGKTRVVVANLTDENELKNAMTIQAGAYETNSRTVRIMFNSDKITQVALANTADFAGATFKNFTKEMTWELLPGNGIKTVYAKLRNAQTGMVTVSDSIVLNASGSTLPPVVSQPTDKPATTVVPALKKTLKRNSSGAEVKQLQLELLKQGYFPKNVNANSIFGPTTESSVKAFEKAKGIKVDGVVDLATWTALFGGQSETLTTPVQSPVNPPSSVQINLYPGARGAAVVEVQTKLQTLGYFPKNVTKNGNFGPATKKSVMAFQKANGISQTGNVGPLTWQALSK